MMYDDNAFITLTYEENPKTLIYKHVQDFLKRLRWEYPHLKIKYICAGEYGSKSTKRPHWHLCVFGWKPSDGKAYDKNEQGDVLYRSKDLDRLWSHGLTDFGNVTFKSAGYVARYHLKKAKDEKNKTVFKMSQGVGKSWLEKYWKDAFSHGEVVLQGGIKSSIPRYYEKWLMKHNTPAWRSYVTQIKYPKIFNIVEKLNAAEKEWKIAQEKRYDSRGFKKEYTKKNWETKAILLEKKIALLKNRLQDAS